MGAEERAAAAAAAAEADSAGPSSRGHGKGKGNAKGKKGGGKGARPKKSLARKKTPIRKGKVGEKEKMGKEEEQKTAGEEEEKGDRDDGGETQRLDAQPKPSSSASLTALTDEERLLLLSNRFTSALSAQPPRLPPRRIPPEIPSRPNSRTSSITSEKVTAQGKQYLQLEFDAASSSSSLHSGNTTVSPEQELHRYVYLRLLYKFSF